MKRMTRRSFVKRSSLAAGAAAALSPWARVLGANNDIRIGTVGFHAQGSYHIKLLRELPGVRVVALCDPDRDVLDRKVKSFADDNQKVAGYTDVRKMLENKDLDAITTATPDHWHALVTILACQAGKDVYVEKPLCHNIWEGRKMVEAARKHKRIVQFGNQSHGQKTGKMRLEMPDKGKILVVFSALNRMRKSIGKVTGPQPVPESIDYNLWTGPAPLVPLHRKRLHYDWHWVWPTGTGELGNNGIYPLDALRLSLGQSALPKRVMCFGGRFLFGDDGTTPNTQVAIYQYDPGPVVLFELRNLPSQTGPKTLPTKMKCEKGESRLPSPSGPSGKAGGFSAHKGHLWNFLSAVRSRKVSDLRADVLEGHLSTCLVHMANISYRLGTEQSPQAAREKIADRGSDATEALARVQEHLAVNGVDFSKAKFTVGPWLEMDAKKEQFVGSDAARANQLVRPEYRKPFVVPDEV